MPRRKKDNSQVTESVNSLLEPESVCAPRRQRNCNKKDTKKVNKTEKASSYFAAEVDVSVIKKKDTNKREKRKAPKIKSNHELSTHKENDSDAGLSEYFSPNQKKKKCVTVSAEEPSSSLAAKIKANMSVEEDSDFENNNLQTAEVISDTKPDRKTKKKYERRKREAGGDKRNSVAKKKKNTNDDPSATEDNQNKPTSIRKNDEGAVKMKQSKASCSDKIDGKPISRKRKSNDSIDTKKSKKIKGKISANDVKSTNSTKNESFHEECTTSSDEKDKCPMKVNTSVKKNAAQRKKSVDKVKPVLQNERESHSELKPCLVEVITCSKADSDDSSDDEMMDVEVVSPKVADTVKISNVSKPLPKALDQTDALAILMHMEGVQAGCSTSVADESLSLTDEDQEESEDEEWEDVEEHHGSTPKKSQIPLEGVEVKFDAPEIYKKRKRGEFDLQGYFRRQINKFKREVAMDIHKVHLLCLLARCQYLNRLCVDEVLQAQALSITLVTKELNIAKSRMCTDQHLNQVLTWIRGNTQYLLEVTEHSLQSVSADIRMILICVILLRQVGFFTRLVTSLQPIPFRTTVSKNAASKKGKSIENDKAMLSKRNSSVKKESKASAKKVKSGVKEKKGTLKKSSVKQEPDKDDVKLEQNSKKRKSGSRKCSKVSKNTYNVDKDSDFENLSDNENDGDYKPEDEELQKKIKKRVRRSGSSEMKEEKDITVKEEQLSDEDFEEDSIIQRSQKLRKLSSSPRNRNDEGNLKSGVDYWLEVYLKKEQRWICIDGTSVEVKKSYEIENTASQPVCYIVGINQENFMKDVTARYASQWLTETRKLRVDGEWWVETLKPYVSRDDTLDKAEDEALNSQLQQRPLPTSIGAFKGHPLYALSRHLLKFEAIYPDTAIPLGYIRGEPVYARECVHTLHSRENWLKEGRAVRIGEEAYKFVKSRPKWNRPKENPEAKDLELFGQWQTEVYIPPPAVDGVVPRNAHGNVEMYQSSMLPAGTVHIKVPGLNKVAKKLDIDCAPAMVGWEQHCGFSHPLMDGWIVCEEHKDILLAAWDEEQEIIREKEQQKREKRVYENWRKLIRGLLIKERLKKRFDLEDKPKDCSNQETIDDESKSAATHVPVTADDVEHSWPQNRLKNKKHAVCVVESL